MKTIILTEEQLAETLCVLKERYRDKYEAHKTIQDLYPHLKAMVGRYARRAEEAKALWQPFYEARNQTDEG